jgi:hypothetical protein
MRVTEKGYMIRPKRHWRVNPVLLLFPVIDALILFLPLVIIWTASLFPETADGVARWSDANPVVVSALGFLVLGVYFTVLFRILFGKHTAKWHGLEHKLIRAEEEGRVWDARNVSPINDRCGTTYLLSLAVVMVVSLVVFGWIFLTLCLLTVVVEGKWFHRYNTPGLLLGRWIQKHNALEPPPEWLASGITGMTELISLENASISVR